MNAASTELPVVLVLAGNDPSGGAGIQADIQTIASLGGHSAPVITAVTAQDTMSVKQFSVIEPEFIVAQARAVLEDMPVAACKIGMLGNTDAVSAVASILEDYPQLPVVLDPVLASDTGAPLAENEVAEALALMLVPHTTVLTPNSLEALRLAPQADALDACAQELMASGCQAVLITGTHEPTADVAHRFYTGARLMKTFSYPRLAGEYHGSGCTLASAIAVNIAHGLDPLPAAAKALEYTWKTLKNGLRIGRGQSIPDRLFWARQPGEKEGSCGD